MDQLNKGEVILIARLGVRRVGFAELSGNYIRAVYVRTKYIRQGIGSALLIALEKEAFSRGIREVHLDSSVNAIGFYESHGYRCVKQTTHRFANGTEIACGLMRKQLCG
jgi:ribosomal protein S18 acetylase RimI-like enzyme